MIKKSQIHIFIVVCIAILCQPATLSAQQQSFYHSRFSGSSTDFMSEYLSTENYESTTGDDHNSIRHNLFSDIGEGLSTVFNDAVHIYSSPARINTESLLWLSGIVVVGGVLYIYDREIYDAVKRSEEDELIKKLSNVGEFFDQVGHGGRMAKYYIAILAAGYLIDFRPALVISGEILETYYIAGLLKNLANRTVGRFRPNEGHGPRYFEFNGGTSFPSGHSANVTQVMTILTSHFDYMPLKIAGWGIITSVSIERLTSDSHWPSDVYFGVVYSYIIAREIYLRHHQNSIKVVPAIDDDMAGLAVSIRF